MALLLFQGELATAMDWSSLKTILTTPIYLAVVLNNAAIGIVTSFFLAQLNSILKTFGESLFCLWSGLIP